MNKESYIFISDNGCGVLDDLLKEDKNSVKAIFLENISTKKSGENSGYGCYIAHEIATQRCGWKLDVENLKDGGAQFKITISHSNK
jgi:sensor histidine kinase regulating citrate/malate metabolism